MSSAFVFLVEMNESVEVSGGDRLSWKNLIPCLSNVENGVKFCNKYGIIPDDRRRNCVNCQAVESVRIGKKSSDTEIPYQFLCHKCGKRTSIRKNTWFEKSKLAIDKSIILIACWIRNYTLQETACETELSIKTICDYFDLCREVCYVIVTNESVTIGGPGKVVEVDEFHISRKNYQRGRPLNKETEDIWVFGGIERESLNCFIVRVHSRDKETLAGLIKHFILPGSKIVTEGFQSYMNLKREGFDDCFVNHSVEFVASPTHNIARLWKSAKASIKKEGRPGERDQLYLFQYLYFHNLKLRGKTDAPDLLPIFLKDVAKVYPGYGAKGLLPAAYTADGVVADEVSIPE